MEIREATPADGDDIKTLVRRSMETSYTLGPGTIDAAVEEWFDENALAEQRDEDGHRILVSERDDEIVGMVEFRRIPGDDIGDVLWLHVDPDYRGEGIGETLFERACEELREMGADNVRGLVLTDNTGGAAFYEGVGFEFVGKREIEIDGRTHTERIYYERPRNGLEVVVDGNREVYADQTDPDGGSLGPFYRTYTDSERENRYGYQCGHCGSLATAMDSMERIECSDCGNTRKPVRWDAAYL